MDFNWYHAIGLVATFLLVVGFEEAVKHIRNKKKKQHAQGDNHECQ